MSLIRDDLADLERYRWQEGWEQHVPPGTTVVPGGTCCSQPSCQR